MLLYLQFQALWNHAAVLGLHYFGTAYAAEEEVWGVPFWTSSVTDNTTHIFPNYNQGHQDGSVLCRANSNGLVEGRQVADCFRSTD